MIYISYVDCIYLCEIVEFVPVVGHSREPAYIIAHSILSKTYTRWEIPDHADHALKYTMIV